MDPVTDPDEAKPKSYGNISEHHWSRARSGENQEALEYYRQRSHAPGVESGGGARNHYCMQCDGVIPMEHLESGATQVCPHCGAALDEHVKRYFNWVEIDEPPASDLRALLPFLVLGLLLLIAAALLAWWFFR